MARFKVEDMIIEDEWDDGEDTKSRNKKNRRKERKNKMRRNEAAMSGEPVDEPYERY